MSNAIRNLPHFIYPSQLAEYPANAVVRRTDAMDGSPSDWQRGVGVCADDLRHSISALQMQAPSAPESVPRDHAELARAAQREGAKADLILGMLVRLRIERQCPADACVPRFTVALRSFTDAIAKLQRHVRDGCDESQVEQINDVLIGLNSDLAGLLEAAKNLDPGFMPPPDCRNLLPQKV